MNPTHLPANFPIKVLQFCLPANPLDSLSADEIRRRMILGADTRSHFDALFRLNQARQLNSVPNPFVGMEGA
jgi:hypothetical protein